MSNLFNDLTHKLQSLSDRFAKDGKKIILSAVSKGGKIGHKGKVQFEIEKLKWELKQQYIILGEYVAEKKISKSITDFSNDRKYLNLVNEANKIRLYINELQKERDDFIGQFGNNS